MPKLKIRSGDSVEVIAGKDRGKRGKVLRVIPEKNRVVVEKLNMMKRHTKPRPAPRDRGGGQQGVIPGGVIEKPGPIHLSNVAHIDPKDGRATRVRIQEIDGVRTRVSARSGEKLD